MKNQVAELLREFREGVRAFLGRPDPAMRRGSLEALQPEAYPPGNEQLSEESDRIVYGL